MRRILLADDEEIILLAYKKILGSSEVQIDTSQSVSEAAYLVNENFYDAVIVDLRLSGTAEMDGLVIIEDVKRISPETRVIVLTAYGDKRIRDIVINAGACCFLEKPISAFLVKEILRSMGVYSTEITS